MQDLSPSFGERCKTPNIFCISSTCVIQRISVHVTLMVDFCMLGKAVEYVIHVAFSQVGMAEIVLKPEQLYTNYKSVRQGCRLFMFLTTGFGKSVCFEVLLFLFDFKLHKVDSSLLNYQYNHVHVPMRGE